MATIRELQARFTASADGIRTTMRSLTGDFRKFGRDSERSFEGTNRSFKNMYRQLDNLPDHLKPFHESLNTTRKELVKLDRQAGKSLDEMADSALKTATSLDKMTSVTDSGKKATKIIQGISDSVKETRLAVMGLNKDGTMKISAEESKAQLIKFREEVEKTKKSLEEIRDAGDFASYEAGMEVLERKMRDVDDSFRAVDRGGKAYTNQLRRMGIVTSDMANEAAIRMEGFKDSFLNSVDLMNARASQSSKMMKILPEVSSIPKLDAAFLKIGDKLENMAKKGTAANLAISMLGKNASMKDLQDRMTLINTGLMRMNSVALAGGIAFAGYTAGMIKLSEAVDGRLGPAFENFKETWLDALTPFAKVWTDVALGVVKGATAVGEFVNKVNELNPSISAAVGMFSYLFTGFSVILAPMAIGIGRAKGMKAAFSSLMLIAKPFVTGFLRIAGMASVLAGGLVLIGGAMMKLWDHSENLRYATGALWATLQDAGADIAKPLVKAFKELSDGFKSLINSFIGSDGKTMADFWQTLGDKIGSVINDISATIMTVTPYITDFISKITEWEGFIPIVAGLATAFAAYKTILLTTTTAQKAWGIVTKASTLLMKAYRAATVAFALAGGGIKGVLAVMTLGMKSLNLTMKANPILLIISLLAGLGVALTIAYKNSETFRKIVNKAWDGIKKGWQATADFFTETIPKWTKDLIKWFGDAKDGVVKKWDDLKKGTIEKFNAIIDFFVKWGPLMLAALGGPIGLAVYAVIKYWDEIVSKTKELLEKARKIVSDKFGAVLKDITDKMKSARNKIEEMWDSAKTKTRDILESLRKTATDKLESLRKSVSTKMTAARDLVRDLWSSAYKKTKELVESIRKYATDKFESMRKGISTKMGQVRDKVSDMWTSAKKKTNDLIDDMVAAAKGMPKRIGDGIKSMSGKALDGVKSLANKMAGGLEKAVNGITQDGINVLLKKIGVKDESKHIKKLKIPRYRTGTDGHPGGLAILGDGKQKELFITPDGQVGMSPATDTLMNLPKDTKVFSGKETQQLASEGLIPKYKNGVGKALSWLKDKAFDVWSYASNPGKLMKKIFGSMDLGLPNVAGTAKEIGKASIGKVKDGAIDFVKKKFNELMPDFGDGSVNSIGGGPSSVNISGGAKAWRGQIIKAAKAMNEFMTTPQLNGIIAQINRESGGNQRIVQSPLVRDINTMNGNPAKGLLQYIPQTFRSYAVKGYNNIFDGYHQLLAWFNNMNWRRDLPYGRSGWGPSGRRKYKNGTDNHPGGVAVLGDGGKNEPFMLPNGQMGLSPNRATLFPNLPAGTKVWSSIQELISNINLEGILNAFEKFAQFTEHGANRINPTTVGSRSFEMLKQSGVGKDFNNNSNNGIYERPINITIEPADVNIDGRLLTQIQYKHIEQKMVQEARLHRHRSGLRGKF